MHRLLLIAAVAASAPLLSAAPRSLGYDPLKQLVLDSRVIEHADHARLVLGTPVKDPRNPLFTADRPWENATNNLYPNVRWDESDGRFKLWYKNVLFDPPVIARMDGPSTVHGVGWYLLYATSRDGLAWEKPALGLHRFDGSADTNIVARDTPNVGVFKDDRDPDPSRRYKMVYDVGLGKPRVRFSADGIHWAAPIEPRGFGAQNGDTHNNAFWDPRIEKYVWFTKLYLGERLVARFESDDFIEWRPSGMVLRSSIDEGRASQTYCLPVFQYGNVYLGYVMMYHVGKGRAVDCELAWSHDGVRWQRLAPGTPFIPRGPPGSYDSQCIYAPAGPAIADGDQLLIFYGGSDFPHTGWKRHCLPSLARLRLDGFAGYEPTAADRPAILLTQPVVLPDGQLSISADVAGGRLHTEVLDEAGTVVARARPVTQDASDLPLVFDRVPPAGRPVRLRFTLERARLYAFSGARLTREELALPPPGELPRFPARAEALHFAFDRDAAGWKGTEQIEHRREGAEGFVSATRTGGLVPFLQSPADPASAPFVGDWLQVLGGSGATIVCRLRAPASGGKFALELFARDAQWSRSLLLPAAPGWQEVTVTLRYDWTDEQALAAGWQRAANAFSWRDTVRHVGRIHLSFAADQSGPRQSFDVDEIILRAVAHD